MLLVVGASCCLGAIGFTTTLLGCCREEAGTCVHVGRGKEQVHVGVPREPPAADCWWLASAQGLWVTHYIHKYMYTTTLGHNTHSTHPQIGGTHIPTPRCHVLSLASMRTLIFHTHRHTHRHTHTHTHNPCSIKTHTIGRCPAPSELLEGGGALGGEEHITMTTYL